MRNTWRSFGLGSALIVLTFVAYLPALRCGFIWDDDDHLTANPAMTAPHGLRMIWSSPAVSRYYPLTLTTFWFERRAWGLNPLPYHLVNIALHAINGLLFFFVLCRLRVPGALLAALVWLLHPVNVESVAWITELKNTQSGFFFFLALLCFLRFEENERPRWYALALLCGLAAMLSKTSTVVFPVVLLLCAWWQRGRWHREDVMRIVPFFALACWTSVRTVIEQRGQILREGTTTEWKLGTAKRLLIAGKAVWFYADHLLWPVRLMFVYPRWDLQAGSILSWMPLAGLVAVGIVLWAWRQQQWARAGLFGIGTFVATLIPILGFLDIYYFRYSYVADHFQYLASAAFIALIAGAGAALCERGGRMGMRVGVVAAPVALAVLGTLSWRQVHIYRNPETLWQDTVTRNPGAWLAHNNLGVALKQEGKPDDAVEHYEQALRLAPYYAEAHSNLGNVLFDLGRTSEAIEQYEVALRLRPDYPEVQYNFANVLRRLGRTSEAIEHYEMALQLRPDYLEVHNNLGLAFQTLGRSTEAAEQYEAALRIDPGYADAHCNLGNLLQNSGKSLDAIKQYMVALQQKPDYPEARYDLGVALQSLGKTTEAEEQYEQALRLKPDYADAHYNLGLLLAQLGRPQEAITEWAQVVRLRPDNAEAHYNLAVLLERSGHTQQAIEHYEQAVRIKPDLTEAKTRLAQLRAAP